MNWCASLGMAETGSGALDWFNSPILDLSDWVETVGEIIKKQKKKSR